MKLEELLASLPVDQWKVGQLYNLDWHDGPREGVCALAAPGGEFHFEIIDERYNPDGLDDRLFRLSELPAGSVATVLNAAGELANRDPSARQRALQCLEAVVAEKRPTALVILSQDMNHFMGIWNVEGLRRNGVDWFTALGAALDLTGGTRRTS